MLFVFYQFALTAKHGAVRFTFDAHLFMNRFIFIAFNVLAFIFCGFIKAQYSPLQKLLTQKRLIIIMFDGFGMSYYKNAPMPFLKDQVTKGFFKEVDALMPTVTNANNASICSGTFPDVNGITGNSFLDKNGEEEYMESDSLLTAPTLFEKLNALGIKSALISSKKKSIGLLARGSQIALSPETADSSWIRRLGKPPAIYSPDINYWSARAALNILENRKDVRCIYLHTTDYPMHSWAPGDSNSLRHLATMDQLIARMHAVAPDAMILITADHDVNHKSRCVDLEKTLATKNIKIKMAISAERDKYLKHHRGFGGTSFVYLKDKNEASDVKAALLNIKGVKTVLSNQEAATNYHLMSSRIGDLVILADSLTVFGNLENKTEESLPENYRTHGSEYEIRVPLIILFAKNLPPANYFKYNMNLTTWLFDKP
jgi:phosphonoacetate hydrolase